MRTSNTTKMTTKGQVTIPLYVRRKLGLKPGDKVTFDVVNEQLVAYRTKSPKEMMGFIKTNKKVSIEQMHETIAEAVAEKFRQKLLKKQI